MLLGRRRIPIAAAAALVAAIAVAGCGSNAVTVPSGRPQSTAQLRDQISRLHAQANTLLDGGSAAFTARLVSLRGVPLVVNQWASWCGPCRYEFPFFAHIAARYQGRVAFLGSTHRTTAPTLRRF